MKSTITYSTLLLLSILFFKNIESFSYYQNNDTIVLENLEILDEYYNQYGYFDSSKFIISKYSSLPSNIGYDLYNKSKYSINNGSIYYDLSPLVLDDNTPYPYNVSIKYQVDNLNYTTYFNLFGKTNYCKTITENFKSSEYQSCILRHTSDNLFSQAGGIGNLKYNLSTIGLVRINYQAIDQSYGCFRNTWFNLKCNENVDYGWDIIKMTVDTPCNYEIFIDTKYACPINTSIKYIYQQINSTNFNAIFKIDNQVFENTFVPYYLNGKLYNLLIKPFNYQTPTPSPTPTPSSTPSSTPSPTPTPSSTPSPTPSSTPTPKITCELSDSGLLVNSTLPIKCTGHGATLCEFSNGDICKSNKGVIECYSKKSPTSILCKGTFIDCESSYVSCSFHKQNTNRLFVNGIENLNKSKIYKN